MTSVFVNNCNRVLGLLCVKQCVVCVMTVCEVASVEESVYESELTQ